MATTFVGRLTRDPKAFDVNGRQKVLFTLAVDRNYSNKDGEREADFPPISAWNGLGDICAKHLAKGRLVSVEAHYRSYVTEKNGQKEYGHEFVADSVRFLDSPKNNNQQNPQGQPVQQGQQNFQPTQQQQIAPQQQQNANQAQFQQQQGNYQQAPQGNFQQGPNAPF